MALMAEGCRSKGQRRSSQLLEQASLIKGPWLGTRRHTRASMAIFVAQEVGLYSTNSPLRWIWNWVDGQVRPLTVQSR